jgi:NADP-dependent 3-hydroxy acid dehydrogenase YdfG
LNRRLASRIVWVTGASSGIGKAIADVFSMYGDTVIATSRLLQKSHSQSGRIDALKCDVRVLSQVQRTARLILKRHGMIDILVNNAGITLFKDLLKTSTAEFDDILATNFRGLFLTTRAVLPSMMKRKRGIILNILSYASKTTYTKSGAYTGAKAGAEAMMNVLREEIRGKGIKVINIHPGAVDTAMWPQRYRAKNKASMMRPHDLAQLLYVMTRQPNSIHVEELVMRPQGGDLQV